MEQQGIFLQQKCDDQKEEALKDFQRRNENLERRIGHVRLRGKGNFVFMAFNWLHLTYLKYCHYRLVKGHIKMMSRKTNHVAQELEAIKTKIHWQTLNKDKIIIERSAQELQNMERIRQVLEDLYPLIAGAIGETKVQNELEKLPDNNVLFNDFSMRFDPPIYNRKEKDKIFSIQIDHLLVTNTGIFILETKNWSRKSLENLDLRSPVKQIRRTSFAMFVVLNSSENTKIGLKQHHWGHKQVPIRSIVVMINEKPKERFKYVKVKTLNELNSYISYFDPIFDDSEVNRISDYLKEMKQDERSIHQKLGYRNILNQVTGRGVANSGLRTWLRDNPGKGINDYYREIREQ